MLKKFLKDKRGVALEQLPGTIMTLLIIAVIFVVGYLMLGGLDDSTTDVEASGAVTNFTNMFDEILSFSNIWGTMIAIAVLLVIVLGAFAVFKAAQSRGLI